MAEDGAPEATETSPGEDDAGWLRGARHVHSPNHDARPAGARIDLLVIHNISLPPGEFGGPWIEHLFLNRLNPDAHAFFIDIHRVRFSAHFFIRRDGELIQFVDMRRRAWHAGRSAFQGREECNDYAIGIELEGTDHTPFTDTQYRQLIAVTKEIQLRFPAITAERITGHSNVAPGRKTDPGPAFEWNRYLAELEMPGA